MIPSNPCIFFDALYLKPMSVLTSSQELEKLSTKSIGELDGFFVIIFIIPPIASDPYRVDAGPFTTSTRWINACGIPVKP